MKQQHTSTTTSILTTKATYRDLNAQRLSERIVEVIYVISYNIKWFHLHYLAIYCILHIPVKYPGDNNKSSRNMFVINNV
jgi:hypothetical protein